jgi:GntR family transcriptional repressor for pyruvate dehydrogenase complex
MEVRLYRRVAGDIVEAIRSGRYKPGDRLPAERDLALEYNVSRPTVREAIITLEAQGRVEIRLGSGAYVLEAPQAGPATGFGITGFELTEARILVEAEACALAAGQITDGEIDELDRLLVEMSGKEGDGRDNEAADRSFHLTIAKATRNAAIVHLVDELWTLRSTEPECALLHAHARNARVRPGVDEHSAIIAALRARDPAGARLAMRNHLGAVMDHLLFTTEAKAVEEARRTVEAARSRFSRTVTL